MLFRSYDPWATRLFAKIKRDIKTGCWNWTASTRQGYGQIWTPSRPGPRRILQAHRAMYELANGPIPDGLDLDHLCRNTLCVNPEHLEPVTRRENVLRGEGLSAQNARKTRCALGHRLRRMGDGRRRCPTCAAARAAMYHATHPQGSSLVPGRDFTHQDVKSWAAVQGIAVARRGPAARWLIESYAATR